MTAEDQAALRGLVDALPGAPQRAGRGADRATLHVEIQGARHARSVAFEDPMPQAAVDLEQLVRRLAARGRGRPPG